MRIFRLDQALAGEAEESTFMATISTTISSPVNLTSASAGGGRMDGFVPFGGAAAETAAGVSDAGSPLSWATDPFHFWTIQG
jgi:hypothetical protein